MRAFRKNHLDCSCDKRGKARPAATANASKPTCRSIAGFQWLSTSTCTGEAMRWGKGHSVAGQILAEQCPQTQLPKAKQLAAAGWRAPAWRPRHAAAASWQPGSHQPVGPHEVEPRPAGGGGEQEHLAHAVAVEGIHHVLRRKAAGRIVSRRGWQVEEQGRAAVGGAAACAVGGAAACSWHCPRPPARAGHSHPKACSVHPTPHPPPACRLFTSMAPSMRAVFSPRASHMSCTRSRAAVDCDTTTYKGE